RDHHVVEDIHIRQFQDRHDSVRVTRDAGGVRFSRQRALIAGKSRVHQHRLSRGRNEQRGLAALGVQEINIQRLFLRLLLRADERKRNKQGRRNEKRHPHTHKNPPGTLRWELWKTIRGQMSSVFVSLPEDLSSTATPGCAVFYTFTYPCTIDDRKTRTGKSACATKTFRELSIRRRPEFRSRACASPGARWRADHD